MSSGPRAHRPDPPPVAVADPVLPGERARTWLLVLILALLVFDALTVARDLFVPIAFAVVFKLLLTPVVRGLARLRIPPPVGAVMALVLLVGIVAGLGTLVAAPAASWLSRAPEAWPRLEHRLQVLAQPFQVIANVQKILEQATQASGAHPLVAVQESGLRDYIVTSTRSIITTVGSIAILLYFMLAAGDHFLRRLVEMLPRLHEKKEAVAISLQVERDISTYLATITLINAGLGTATGLAMALIGLPDPVLWGVLAMVLNFMPYLGPLVMVVTLTLAGSLSFDPLVQALLPPAAYYGLALIEGQLLTPLILARRLTLNPVALFLAMLVFGWMWAVPGILLAVPLLAIVKILFDHVEPLSRISGFIGE